MNMIQYWIFRQWVRILCRTKAVQYVHSEAWYAGWEARTLILETLACPDDWYPGIEKIDKEL